MKKITLLLLVISLLPAGVLAWSLPGEDFSGELRLSGTVGSTRNPWIWKVGKGHTSLEVKSPSATILRGNPLIPVPLPALTVLLGKTMLVTPAGREGLAPQVVYGRGANGFTLVWLEPGTAELTLPLMRDDNTQAGEFTFRIQAAALLRHEEGGQSIYARLYDDLQANGLPAQQNITSSVQTAPLLQAIFAGEGPAWLAQKFVISEMVGLSRFTDAGLRQVEGVYGAQVVAGSGGLRLKGDLPTHWRVSLPVSIEYQ